MTSHRPSQDRRRRVGVHACIHVGITVSVAALAACDGGQPPGASPETERRLSEFGAYEGYSEARFDSWVRTSQYVATRDGTRLAVDIVRPAVSGVVADEPLPVVWTHSRYHRTPANIARAFQSPDTTATDGSEEGAESGGRTDADTDRSTEPQPVPSIVDGNPGLERLVRHGYVVVAVGVRGSGASFGRYEGLFSPAETRDAYDVIDWISSQPWSDGNVGMFGGSYLGITQYMAASVRHPALKAIFPTVALFDMYDALYPGGVYREDMIGHWGLLTRRLDAEVQAPPVDEDPDGALLAMAVAEHEDNWDVEEHFRAARFRDHDVPDFAWSRHNPSSYLEEMNASGVAAYHWGGWYDTFAMDEALWYRNWTGPDLMGMGPWSHAFQPPEMAAERARLEAIEQHRFFDRFLKGVDNGIMDEPGVRYALVDDWNEWSWNFADDWPPPQASPTRYVFAPGPSGSISSVNDGALVPEDDATAMEDGGESEDEYQIDPTTTTGGASRWDNAVGQGPMIYPDMASNDAKSLTYTTTPLESDVAVVGHPVATLYVSADAPDADLYVLLEEVAPDGQSRYVSEGTMRASHRSSAAAPWDNLGLPYQTSAEADLAPLVPGEVVQLSLDLQPTATLFNAGNRIRITVMGADADNTEPPPATPRIRLHRSAEHPSGVVLPILADVGSG